MIITKENFEDYLNKLCVGVNKANNYNSECFSTSDVLRARSVTLAMDKFIERVDNAGYSASSIMNPIKKQHNRWVIGDSAAHLKQNLDDDFKVDMSDFQQVNTFCEDVYGSERFSASDIKKADDVNIEINEFIERVDNASDSAEHFDRKSDEDLEEGISYFQQAHTFIENVFDETRHYEVNFYGEGHEKDWTFYIKSEKQLTNEQVKAKLQDEFIGTDGLEQHHIDNIDIIREISANEFVLSTGLQA